VWRADFDKPSRISQKRPWKKRRVAVIGTLEKKKDSLCNASAFNLGARRRETGHFREAHS